MISNLTEKFLNVAYQYAAKLQSNPRPLNLYFTYQYKGAESVSILVERSLSRAEENKAELTEANIDWLTQKHPVAVNADYSDVIIAFTGEEALKEFDKDVEDLKRKAAEKEAEENRIRPFR